MKPFPNKKYQIIYADPPWKYWAGGKKNASRHYDCMEIEDIYNLPISDIKDPNCLLFLWATFPCLPEGIETIKRWGFQYSTVAFVWIKGKKSFNKNQYSFLPSDGIEDFFGCGGWTRANAEICLIGKYGKIERQSKNVRQIIYSCIQKHSKKPDETRDKIVELCGDLPRIELFARQKTEGWDVWGNEI